MAYDSEARATGNAAMIIGVVVLVLIVGAVALFATNREPAPTVVTVPGRTTIVKEPAPAPAPATVINEAPDAPVIINQQPAPAPREKVITRDSETNIRTENGVEVKTQTDRESTEVR